MNETNTLTTTEPQQLPVHIPSDVSAGAMAAALAGDLSKLTEQDKLKFVGALCEFTGLNVLSKPFDWIVLGGKLTLYANKGCAEQLRKIHGVTIEILERRTEHGIHTVRVRGVDKSGRFDESIGAVPFDEKMTALDRANAVMKAETKAKRRVSLSIVGLGLLDESELDLVRNAKPVSEVMSDDSAAAIADKLNAELKPEPKIQEAEIVALPPVKVEPKKAEPIIDADEFGQPEPTVQTPASGQLSEAEKLAMELETVLSGYTERINAADTVSYCQKQGKLPADTKNLAAMDAEYAAKVLRNPKGFVSAVEAWVKGGRK